MEYEAYDTATVGSLSPFMNKDPGTGSGRVWAAAVAAEDPRFVLAHLVRFNFQFGPLVWIGCLFCWGWVVLEDFSGLMVMRCFF